MQIFASKLITLVYILFIVTLGLTGWGFAQSSSAKKEIDKENAALEQQLKSSPQSLNFSGDQTATAPTNPSSSPATNTGTGSPPPAAKPIPISDATKQEATQKVYAIDGRLEAYQTQYGYYPSDIAPSTFAGDGCTGDGCTSMFAPPTGVHFVYTPSPSGCTTVAQSCQHFTLDAVDSGGNLIFEKTSISFN